MNDLQKVKMVKMKQFQHMNKENMINEDVEMTDWLVKWRK